MMCLPKVGRVLVLLVVTFLGWECDLVWAEGQARAAGGKAACLDRPARTGDPVDLLKSLETQRLALEERTRRLVLREADLTQLEARLAKRITALEQLRENLRTDLAKESAADDANIAHLAKIFSGMKTKAAASGLSAMDVEMAVLVLKRMREKVAAKILSKMESGDAVRLARRLGMSLSERSAQ